MNSRRIPRISSILEWPRPRHMSCLYDSSNEQSECGMTGGVAGVDPCWIETGRAPTPPAIHTRFFYFEPLDIPEAISQALHARSESQYSTKFQLMGRYVRQNARSPHSGECSDLTGSSGSSEPW